MEPERVARLARALPDALVVLDELGAVVWCNETAERLVGAHLDELQGANAVDLLHPDDRQLAALSLLSVRAKTVGTPLELRVATPRGWRLMEVIGANLLDDADVAGIVLVMRDLTERRRWEVAAGQDARFRALVQNAAGIVMLTDAEGRIESVSGAFTRLLGYDPEVAAGSHLREFVTPTDQPALDAAVARALADPHLSTRPTTAQIEFVRRGDGAAVPFEVSIVNLVDDPTVGGLVVSAHDISELRAAREAIDELATRDTLTGLPNRAMVLERIAEALSSAARHARPVDLLLVDIDGFHDLNATLGHHTGDRVLQAVASRLSLAFRGLDLVGRIGADEFVVLVADPARAARSEVLAERLHGVLREPFALDTPARPVVRVTASIGVVSGHYQSPDTLLADAHIALGAARAAGGDRYVVFEPGMRDTVEERFDLGADLELALRTGQFALVFQPVFRLADLAVTGAEALLRWRHPTRGTITPERFLPVLERSAAIDDVGRFVLGTACRQARAWRDVGLMLGISVNVAGRQLAHDDFVLDLRQAIHDTAIDPSSVVVELTETALLGDRDGVGSRLRAIKDLGVKVAIDDFGTGYSSLVHLRRYPLDIMKIDRSFVASMARDPESASMVRALVHLGRSLGLRVVAEGIETEEQLERLRTEGCDAGQGYLLAPPLDPAQLGPVLAGSARRRRLGSPGGR